MHKQIKKQRLERLIFIVLSLLISGFFLFSKGFSFTEKRALFHRLHDAFFSTGILFLGIAGLRLIAKTDFFSGVFYVAYSVKKTLFPFANGERESYQTFFKKRNERTDKKKMGKLSMLAEAGIFSLLLGMLFLAFWRYFS